MKRFLSVIMTLIMAVATLSVVAFGVGCGGSDPNTVKYIIYTSGGNIDGSERVAEEFDKQVFEKLGFHVELEYLGFNQYSQQLSLYQETKADFDMCFTGSIISDLPYSENAVDGYFADITDALPQYAPELYNSMDVSVWDAAKINGKIYGVINEQIFARSVGLSIDKTVATAIGLTQQKIDEQGITYRQAINQAMEYIKESPVMGDAGTVPSTTLVIGSAWEDIFMQNYSLDALGTSSYYPGIIEAGKNSTEVINQYTSAYFKEFADFCVEMYDKGYMITQQASNPITTNQRVRITGTYKPGEEASLKNAIGREFVQFRFGAPLLTTASVTTSMTAINVNSKKVDKCLQLLNALHTDAKLYNLLALGMEGIDYTWQTGYEEDETEYQYIAYSNHQNANYKLNTDWSVGKELLVYRKEGQSSTVVQETKALNSNSHKSPAYGFTYQPKTVTSAKLADTYRIADTYIIKFLNGTYNKQKSTQEIIDEMVGKMTYMTDIITEKQAQLNAFLNK